MSHRSLRHGVELLRQIFRRGKEYRICIHRVGRNPLRRPFQMVHIFLFQLRFRGFGVLQHMVDLRWVKNDIEGAHFAFGEGRATPALTYLGAPIQADFKLSFESLAPFVTEVLDQAAPLEGAGLHVKLVEIKEGVVKVW